MIFASPSFVMLFTKFNAIFFVLLLSFNAAACTNEENRDRIRDFKAAFIDFLEGRGGENLLKFMPTRMSDFKVTMDSGKNVMFPESFDDVEFILEDVAGELRGDAVSVVQIAESESADLFTLTFTVKITDGSFARTLPMRSILRKDSVTGKWVWISLDLFN